MNSPPPEYEIFDFYVQSNICKAAGYSSHSAEQLVTAVILYEGFKYATSIVRCIKQD
jgi:galactokinase